MVRRAAEHVGLGEADERHGEQRLERARRPTAQRIAPTAARRKLTRRRRTHLADGRVERGDRGSGSRRSVVSGVSGAWRVCSRYQSDGDAAGPATTLTTRARLGRVYREATRPVPISVRPVSGAAEASVSGREARASGDSVAAPLDRNVHHTPEYRARREMARRPSNAVPALDDHLDTPDASGLRRGDRIPTPIWACSTRAQALLPQQNVGAGRDTSPPFGNLATSRCSSAPPRRPRRARPASARSSRRRTPRPRRASSRTSSPRARSPCPPAAGTRARRSPASTASGASARRRMRRAARRATRWGSWSIRRARRSSVRSPSTRPPATAAPRSSAAPGAQPPAG